MGIPLQGAGVIACNWRVLVAAVLLLAGSSALSANTYEQVKIADFTNIDCGATEPYADPATGLKWVPEAAFITTGKVHTNLIVPTGLQSFTEFSSLRYFDDPSRRKNCYALPVTANSFYMLRATFFYGNYDNAAKPPSFQLAVDTTIVDNITTSVDEGHYVEYTYMAHGNMTFLCLIRESSALSTTPFISGISLRPANLLVTAGSFSKNFGEFLQQGTIMKTIQRVNFGGTKMLRSPDDTYDRWWHSEGTSSQLLTPTPVPVERLSITEAMTDFVGSTSKSGRPPLAAIQTAVTTNNTLVTHLLPKSWNGVASAYVRSYHVDLTSGPRNFSVLVPFTGQTHVDIAGIGLDWEANDISGGPIGPDTTMNMTKDENSVGGPLLNTMEVFSMLEKRESKTVERDVMAIESIKSSLNLTEWSGDPCLLLYPHSWLNCSTTAIASQSRTQVTAVNISGYNLKGVIPPSFANLLDITNLSLDNNNFFASLPDLSSLTNIIILKLENNNLSGVLPEWLTSLKDLRELSVQNNNFSGPIPAALLSTNTLKFTYLPGNPLLSGVAQSTSNSSNSRAIIGASIGGVLGIILILGIVICLFMRLKHNTSPNNLIGKNPEIGSSIRAKAYTLAEVRTMTMNFKTEIGKGGFGKVYYGKLLDRQDEQHVAVKVADGSTIQGENEFFNEVNVLSRVRHKNLVALVGYCQDENKQILIYEYMENGSLHGHLFGISHRAVKFDWRMRLHIALNAAQGLEYLHAGCSPSFIHRDIKSSNILLTAKYDAKVADFGLTKLIGEDESTRVLTLVKGTAGYLDPEYNNSHYLTTKSDIFSFGIVLLELLTRRPPINRSTSNIIYPNICEWVRAGLKEGDINVILDPAVKSSCPTPNQDALWSVVEIALQCVESKSIHRPTMTVVLQELQLAVSMEESIDSSSNSYRSSNYFESEMAPMAK